MRWTLYTSTADNDKIDNVQNNFFIKPAIKLQFKSIQITA